MKMKIIHRDKNGKESVLFECSDSPMDRMSFVNWYNFYSRETVSGSLFGYEGDKILYYNTFDYPNIPVYTVKNNIIET